MRIIIEFEGIEATVKKEQTGAVASKAPGMPATPTEVAPPGGLAAAVAAGALSAGPAPNVASQTPGVPPLPLSMTGPGAPVDGAGGLPAGVAPNLSF
jgi:hypothetical protein